MAQRIPKVSLLKLTQVTGDFASRDGSWKPSTRIVNWFLVTVAGYYIGLAAKLEKDHPRDAQWAKATAQRLFEAQII